MLPIMLNVTVHSEDVDLVALCRVYWERDADGWAVSVSEIAQRFGIPRHDVARRVRNGCVALDLATRCADCGLGLPVSSRAEYPASRPIDGLCSECRLVRRMEADREAAERLSQQRAIVAHRYAMLDTEPVDPEELTFGQATALLSVLRVGTPEDGSRILPMREWDQPLAPTDKLSIDLIRDLFQAGHLNIGPSSPVAAFEWDGFGTPRLFLDSVEWRLSGYGPHRERVRTLTDHLQRGFRDVAWPDRWIATWRPSWDRLMMEETLAYLVVCLEEHGLPFKPGDKTYDVLDYVLGSFSLGQAYNFVWRAARDAAAYWMRERVPKQRAANTVVGSIRSQAERALAENWDVKHYRRDRRCAVTVLGEVVYSLALKIPDPFAAAPDSICPPVASQI